jgi:hypothetical protein
MELSPDITNVPIPPPIHRGPKNTQLQKKLDPTDYSAIAAKAQKKVRKQAEKFVEQFRTLMLDPNSELAKNLLNSAKKGSNFHDMTIGYYDKYVIPKIAVEEIVSTWFGLSSKKVIKHKRDPAYIKLKYFTQNRDHLVIFKEVLRHLPSNKKPHISYVNDGFYYPYLRITF